MRHGRRRNLLKPPCRKSLNPVNRQPGQPTPAPCSCGTRHTLLLLKPIGVGLPPLALRPPMGTNTPASCQGPGHPPLPRLPKEPARLEHRAAGLGLCPSSITHPLTLSDKTGHMHGPQVHPQRWGSHPIHGAAGRVGSCGPSSWTGSGTQSSVNSSDMPALHDRARTTSLQPLPPLWFSLQ